jgi:hypothetical protein
MPDFTSLSRGDAVSAAVIDKFGRILPSGAQISLCFECESLL